MSTLSNNLELVLPDLQDEIPKTIEDLNANFRKIDEVAELYMTSPPTAGVWRLNRRVWNSVPQIDSHLGWINIREGMAAPRWGSITSYSLGDVVVPVNDNGHVYRCIQTGYSSYHEPLFPLTNSGTVVDVRNALPWMSNRENALNNVVLPSVDNGYFYICTTAGRSASAQPTWSTGNGLITNDGTTVWTGYRIARWQEIGIACNFRPFGKIE